MQKILVTGANGFVGQHMCTELLARGYNVVGIGGPLKGIGVARHAAYLSLSLDLTDSQAVKQIDFTEVDAVIHLAGLAAVGPSFDNPMLYIDTNVRMEANLYQVALEQGASPKFLIISSGSLYDPKASLPLAETSPVIPSSPYAVSKLGQEQLAQYYGSRGIEYMIARPFNHVGPGQGEGFLVPDLSKQIVEAEKSGSGEINVGNLEAKRDYTDVRDIVKAYRLLIESSKSGEIYNICTGTSRSGKEILEKLVKLSPAQITVVPDKARMRPSDTPDIYGDHDKLSKHTGWVPEINLDKTLEDALNDWRNKK